MQFIRDLFLGEPFLLVLHGPLRDRVHVFHPTSHSGGRDAGRRISKYRTPAIRFGAAAAYGRPFCHLLSFRALRRKTSRMYFIGKEPALRLLSRNSWSEKDFPRRF